MLKKQSKIFDVSIVAIMGTTEKKAGSSFECGETGHLYRNCPRRVVATMDDFRVHIFSLLVGLGLSIGWLCLMTTFLII